MPIFLLKFLPLVRKHWKLVVVAVLLAGAFTSGWRISGTRWEAKVATERAERQTAVTEAVLARELELRLQWNADLAVAKGVAVRLTLDLTQVRVRNSDLLAEIATRSLVKPTVISCDITGETVNANPFNDNFVDLWNAAGRLRDD